MANGALAPLLLAIFLGPIGAEGYVLRNSCANLTAGVRNVALGSSIAKHVLLGALIIVSVITVFGTAAQAAQNDETLTTAKKMSETMGAGTIAIAALSSALSITCIVAIVNVVIAWGQC